MSGRCTNMRRSRPDRLNNYGKRAPQGSDYQKMLSKNLGADRGAKAVGDLLEEELTFLQDLVAWVGSVNIEAEAESGVDPGPVPTDGV